MRWGLVMREQGSGVGRESQVYSLNGITGQILTVLLNAFSITPYWKDTIGITEGFATSFLEMRVKYGVRVCVCVYVYICEKKKSARLRVLLAVLPRGVHAEVLKRNGERRLTQAHTPAPS